MRLKEPITLISVVLFLVLIGVALFLYNYNFPKKVNVERTAVVFTLNNSSSAKSTIIKVNGTLYKPIFGQKKFVGNVSIDAYDFTKDQEVTVYITKRNKGINMSTLFYLEKNLAFIATGSNYEQALQTQIMMRKKFGDMFVPHEYDSLVK